MISGCKVLQHPENPEEDVEPASRNVGVKDHVTPSGQITRGVCPLPDCEQFLGAGLKKTKRWRRRWRFVVVQIRSFFVLNTWSVSVRSAK